MTTTIATLPSIRWDLVEQVRATVDGTEWVAYVDGQFVDVVPAADYDAETAIDDYSHWCSTTSTPGVAVYRALMTQLGDTYWRTGAHGGVSLV